MEVSVRSQNVLEDSTPFATFPQRCVQEVCISSIRLQVFHCRKGSSRFRVLSVETIEASCECELWKKHVF